MNVNENEIRVMRIDNEDFNSAEFNLIKNEAPKKSFTMSPSQWCMRVNAKGITYSKGKYSVGTFTHSDIALEFASWIDNLFKLYLIKEFKRLKYNESYQEKIEWSVRRSLSKTNYRIHTDSIKENIVPKLTERQKDRLEKLNQTARKELEILSNNKNIIGIQNIDEKSKLIEGKQ